MPWGTQVEGLPRDRAAAMSSRKEMGKRSPIHCSRRRWARQEAGAVETVRGIEPRSGRADKAAPESRFVDVWDGVDRPTGIVRLHNGFNRPSLTWRTIPADRRYMDSACRMAVPWSGAQGQRSSRLRHSDRKGWRERFSCGRKASRIPPSYPSLMPMKASALRRVMLLIGAPREPSARSGRYRPPKSYVAESA